MKNYDVFYSFSKEREYLLILFSDEKITYQKSFGKIVVSYHNVDVVSYKIKDIDKIIKIHADGLIPLINQTVLSIINNLLIKEGLEPLFEKTHSDFYNAIVLSKNPTIVKTIDGEYEVNNDNVKINDHVVLAKQGSFLFDKTYLKENHLCTYKDLEISDSDEVLIDNELDINEDFFLTSEEK